LPEPELVEEVPVVLDEEEEEEDEPTELLLDPDDEELESKLGVWLFKILIICLVASSFPLVLSLLSLLLLLLFEYKIEL